MKKNPKSLSPVEDEIKDMQTERKLIKNRLADPDNCYNNPFEYSNDAKRLKEINALLNKFYLVSRGL